MYGVERQGELPRPYRPPWVCWSSSTQGIGLRPQPWAKISRPVGPVLGSEIAVLVESPLERTLRRDVNRYRSSDIRARPLISPAKRGQRGRPRPPPSPWQKGVSIVKEHCCPPRER